MIAGERFAVLSREVSSPAMASTEAAAITTGTPPLKGEWRSSKMRPRHLEREAIVYVRQSTPHQIVEHGESLARQYALRDRATALGWPPPNVLLIDDDLGQSGRGSDDRHGFQRLLADVAQDRVGLVLALEMSRLAQQQGLALNKRRGHALQPIATGLHCRRTKSRPLLVSPKHRFTTRRTVPRPSLPGCAALPIPFSTAQRRAELAKCSGGGPSGWIDQRGMLDALEVHVPAALNHPTWVSCLLKRSNEISSGRLTTVYSLSSDWTHKRGAVHTPVAHPSAHEETTSDLAPENPGGLVLSSLKMNRPSQKTHTY